MKFIQLGGDFCIIMDEEENFFFTKINRNRQLKIKNEKLKEFLKQELFFDEKFFVDQQLSTKVLQMINEILITKMLNIIENLD